VNYARVALAFLGATVAYFGCGFVIFAKGGRAHSACNTLQTRKT